MMGGRHEGMTMGIGSHQGGGIKGGKGKRK